VLSDNFHDLGESCVSSKALPLGSNSSVAEASLLAFVCPFTKRVK